MYKVYNDIIVMNLNELVKFACTIITLFFVHLNFVLKYFMWNKCRTGITVGCTCGGAGAQ